MKNFRRILALLALAGTLVYFNGLNAPFVFDDEEHIVVNPFIRSLWPPWTSMFATINSARPLVGLSFAINHAISGVEPWSYHLANLVIHVGAAAALWLLIESLFRSPLLRQRFEAQAGAIATCVALLWVVHPLNAQAVTYTAQRFQSLMGFFYFACVAAALKSLEETPKASRWRYAAWLCAFMGVLCKQDMVSAPLIVAGLCALYYRSSLKETWLRDRSLFAGLLVSWLPLGLVNILAPRMHFAGFRNETVTPKVYALTQTDVLTHYLTQSFWPTRLAFDYAWPRAFGVGQVFPQFVFIALLLGITLWGLRQRRAFAGAGLWFFGTLALTSSFLPIADSAWDYRMYLALAAVLTLVVAGASRFIAKPAMLLAAITPALIFFGWRTHSENEHYRTELDLWTTTAERRPQNARAANNVGVALERLGRASEAESYYLKAHEIDPNHPGANNNIGRRLSRAGRHNEALALFDRAIAVDPYFAEAHHHRAMALQALKRIPEAVGEYQEALRLAPSLAEAHNGLGEILFFAGKFPDAASQFQQAITLKPTLSEPFFNLGTIYVMQGDKVRARELYLRTIERKPGHTGALNNLGLLALEEKKTTEAAAYFARALEYDPKSVDALSNSGYLAFSNGEWNAAEANYKRLLELSPGNPKAIEMLKAISKARSKKLKYDRDHEARRRF